MKILLVFLFFLMNGCALLKKLDRTDRPKSVAFSRYLMVSTCFQSEKICRAPVAIDLEKANVTVPFTDNVAQSNMSVIDRGITFAAKVIITGKDDGFQIDLILQSGGSQKRSAEKMTLNVKDLNHFKEVVVMDKPVAFAKGIVRAQLVFGPPLKGTK